MLVDGIVGGLAGHNAYVIALKTQYTHRHVGYDEAIKKYLHEMPRETIWPSDLGG